jgi:hypothetical protein
MDTREQIALGAMIISLISAGISVFFALKSAKRADETLKLQKDTARRADAVLELQQKMSKRTDKALELQYLFKIHDWTSDVISVMSEASSLCRLDPSKMEEKFFFKQSEIYTKLSTLIDQGRLYFPNSEDDYGKEKEEAYQGIVHRTISLMKDALGIVERINYKEKSNNGELGKTIIEIKRKFVSEIQKIIAPRETAKFFNELRENLFKDKIALSVINNVENKNDSND